MTISHDVIFHVYPEDRYVSCPAMALYGAYLQYSTGLAVKGAIGVEVSSGNVFGRISDVKPKGEHVVITRQDPPLGSVRTYRSRFGPLVFCNEEFDRLFPGSPPERLFVEFGRVETIQDTTIVCERYDHCSAFVCVREGTRDFMVPLSCTAAAFLWTEADELTVQPNRIAVRLSTAPWSRVTFVGTVLAEPGMLMEGWRTFCVQSPDCEDEPGYSTPSAQRIIRVCCAKFDTLFPTNPKVLFGSITALPEQ